MHDDRDLVRDSATGPLLARLASVYLSAGDFRRAMLVVSLSFNARRLVMRSKGQFGRMMMRSQGLDPRASSHAYGVPPAH